MRASHCLSLILAMAALPACQAAAQTLPWPTDPPRAAGVPSQPAPGAASPMVSGAIPGAIAAPGPMPAPMFSMPAPAIGSGPPQGGGAPPPCLAEFLKLREDVDKKGRAAKQASEHKATREEMCKQITVYAAAELKWVKFTESNSASCGIPPTVAKELKTVHGHTEETKAKLCAPGAMGVASAPSLSDALGTTRLPTPETTHTGSGTLDTLTGNAIQR